MSGRARTHCTRWRLANRSSDGGDAITTFFDLTFLQSLVANLAGTFLALFGAYWLYRWQESRQNSQARIARSTRREQLLNALNETVTKNKLLVEQVQSDLENGIAPTYSVDLTTLQWLTTETGSGLIDVSLIQKMGELRYELDHLGTQLNAQLQLWLNSAVLHTISIQIDGREIRAYPYQWNEVVGGIKAHIPGVLKVCKEMDTLTSQLRP
jgi:hypothetical protein